MPGVTLDSARVLVLGGPGVIGGAVAEEAVDAERELCSPGGTRIGW